ncbi:MAG: nucleoside triphosphate pyrophosphohydrolase family protein [Dehalococcoidia bacterium]|jgi:NTP pyrophosphatase (non-canonical NTP hydrolase)
MTIKTFEEYQAAAISMRVSLDKFKENFPGESLVVLELLALSYDGLGLGEAGEVQGKIKKIIRDEGGIITIDAKKEIAKELGDCLWYIASMCDNLNLDMGEVATMNIEKLRSRHERGTVHGNGDNR